MDDETLIAVLTPVVLEESQDRPARRKRRRARGRSEPVVLWEWKAERPADPAGGDEEGGEGSPRGEESPRG